MKPLPSPSSPYPQPQYKKFFCAYHPTQFLTNFCLQSTSIILPIIEQCLMPLCPSCVVQHTEQHYQVKQKPRYINLNDAISEVRQQCYQQVQQLEDFYRVNDQIMSYIEGLKLYIRKQLTIAKQSLFQQITQLFTQYETSLHQLIVKNYQKAQVYNFQESQQVKASILENIESLYDKTSQLKGDQCLSALIKYYGEDQEIVTQNIQVIKEYLEKNKSAGGIHVGLDQDRVNEVLEGLCEKVVCLKTITEKDLAEEAMGNNRKGSNTQSSSRKPITISSRLRSPLGPIRKNGKNQNYESPFKDKPFKPSQRNQLVRNQLKSSKKF